MNIEAAFPSKFLKAADLQGRIAKVTIRTVLMEEIGDGNEKKRKPILYFQGKERGVVLNRTNASLIAHFYGQDTDQWIGKEIELFTDMVPFQGRMVEALRVRVPRGSPQPAAVRAPEPPPPPPTTYLRDEIDDEIPF